MASSKIMVFLLEEGSEWSYYHNISVGCFFIQILDILAPTESLVLDHSVCPAALYVMSLTADSLACSIRVCTSQCFLMIDIIFFLRTILYLQNILLIGFSHLLWHFILPENLILSRGRSSIECPVCYEFGMPQRGSYCIYKIKGQ